MFFYTNVLRDFIRKTERYYYLQIVFSLKLNLLLVIIKLTLLKNKALFHLFVWLEITLPILLFRSKLLSGIAKASIFTLVTKKKYNLQGKRVTENKLKSSDYGFNISRNGFQFLNSSKQN